MYLTNVFRYISIMYIFKALKLETFIFIKERMIMGNRSVKRTKMLLPQFFFLSVADKHET